MDVGRGFISKVVRDGLVGEAISLGLDESLLLGDELKVWRWMREYFASTGESPRRDAVTSVFPDYELIEVTDGLQFYVSGLVARFHRSTTVSLLRHLTQFLKEKKDPMLLPDIVQQYYNRMAATSKAKEDRDWTKTADIVLAEYEQAASSSVVVGIPWLFKGLNAPSMGKQPGDFIAIVARSGVGKSWMEVIEAYNDWLNGYVPILLSKEMPSIQFMRRLWGVAAGLSYRELRKGALSDEDKERWLERIKEIGETDRPFIISDGSEGGVADVAAKIDKYKPDIVYIDGMYLMEDDRGARSGWERVTHIARDLKRLARKKHIPIVVSVQFRRDDGVMDESSIAYGDISKELDGLIALRRTTDQKLNNTMGIESLKWREGFTATPAFEVIWDLDNMVFREEEGSNMGEFMEDSPMMF